MGIEPASDTKNTWRRAPSSAAVLTMRATILNWSARLLFDGDTVASVGPPAREATPGTAPPSDPTKNRIARHIDAGEHGTAVAGPQDCVLCKTFRDLNLLSRPQLAA